jgi:outer membrane receptor for ferrienterochelin and colicin
MEMFVARFMLHHSLQYAQAIGIICFIASEDIQATAELMKVLESTFAKSYLAADGSVPIVTRGLQELHTAALSSWTLLLSTMPDGFAHDLIRL